MYLLMWWTQPWLYIWSVSCIIYPTEPSSHPVLPRSIPVLILEYLHSFYYCRWWSQMWWYFPANVNKKKSLAASYNVVSDYVTAHTSHCISLHPSQTQPTEKHSLTKKHTQVSLLSPRRQQQIRHKETTLRCLPRLSFPPLHTSAVKGSSHKQASTPAHMQGLLVARGRCRKPQPCVTCQQRVHAGNLYVSPHLSVLLCSMCEWCEYWYLVGTEEKDIGLIWSNPIYILHFTSEDCSTLNWSTSTSDKI